MAVIDRDEMLQLLLRNAQHLDDRQLEEAAALLEDMAFPERAERHRVASDDNSRTMPYVDFIAELSDKIRTAGETA